MNPQRLYAKNFIKKEENKIKKNIKKIFFNFLPLAEIIKLWYSLNIYENI